MADRAASLAIAMRALAKARMSPQQFAGLWNDLAALARLVSAWATREYDVVPWRAIAMASAALVYFLNPLDAVPDAILGIGYLDDASVLALVAGGLKHELDRFVAWERDNAAPTPRKKE